MKKITGFVLVGIAMCALAYAGENYFHTIKAEFGGFATGLGVGKSEPAAGYALDLIGASRLVGAVALTGAPTIVGNPVITGNPAVTGTATVVGSISVSSNAATTYVCKNYGAVDALSTHSVVACSQAFLFSDAKLYIATTTTGENADTCVSGTCWKAAY